MSFDSTDLNFDAITPTLERGKTIVMIDVETFGIDPVDDPVIEVGLQVCDRTLHVIYEHSWLVWDSWYNEELKKLESAAASGGEAAQAVFQMHTESGLWVDAKANGQPVDVIEQRILEWLDGIKLPKGLPFVGSSVAFDRYAMFYNMRRVADRFHYRVIDISSFREALKIWDEEVGHSIEDSVAAKKSHRVMDDLDDSRILLAQYLPVLFGWEDINLGIPDER